MTDLEKWPFCMNELAEGFRAASLYVTDISPFHLPRQVW